MILSRILPFLFFIGLIIQANAQTELDRFSEIEIVDSLLKSTPEYSPFVTNKDGLLALSIARRLNYKLGEISALSKLALNYKEIQNQQLAFDYSLKAIELAEDLEDPKKIMKAQYVAAKIYREFGPFKEAFDLGKAALETSVKFGDSLLIAHLTLNNAMVHWRLQQRKEFFEIGEQALSMFQTLDDPDGMALSYIRLGSIYKDMQKRFAYFKNAEELLPRIDNEFVRKKRKLLLYLFYAITHLDNQDYDLAEQPTNICLEIAIELGNKNVEAIMHGYLSKIYFYKYGDNQKSIHFGLKYLEYEIGTKRHWYAIPTAQFLMEVYTADKNYDEAFNMAQMAMDFQDTLYWANRRNDASDLENKYAEINKLEKERQLRTILGMGGTSFFLILTGLFYRQRQLKNAHLKIQERFNEQLKRDKLLIETQKEQLEKLNATKDRLFSIIGHDLRGPLFSLQGLDEQVEYLIETNQKSRLRKLSQNLETTTKHLINTLSGLLMWARNQMGSLPYHPEKISLKGEIDNVLNLFKVKLELNKIRLSVDVLSEIQIYMDPNALKTILRNVVSNSLKFTNEGGEIKIKANHQKNKVTLIISDSGIGMSESQVRAILNGVIVSNDREEIDEQCTGIGMLLIRDLLILNNSKIDIRSRLGEGSEFEFSFPTSKVDDRIV